MFNWWRNTNALAINYAINEIRKLQNMHAWHTTACDYTAMLVKAFEFLKQQYVAKGYMNDFEFGECIKNNWDIYTGISPNKQCLDVDCIFCYSIANDKVKTRKAYLSTPAAKIDCFYANLNGQQPDYSKLFQKALFMAIQQFANTFTYAFTEKVTKPGFNLWFSNWCTNDAKWINFEN